jgi:hypothetical protein
MSYFNTQTNTAFDQLFNSPSTMPIEFNPEWNNGTGYLNNAVENDNDMSVAPILSAGETRKCMTSNNRPVVLVGTQGFGNVVLFRRYSMVDDCPAVVANMTSVLGRVIDPLPGERLDGQMSEEKINHLITSCSLLAMVAA